MMELVELEALVGWNFPGGTWQLEPWWDSLACDVFRTETPARDGVAHPMGCYFAALGGMGLTWDELFAVCGSSASEGPMIGDCEIELCGPMATGVVYEVSGAITKTARKQGRSGVFDVVVFRLEVRHRSGALAGVSTNTLVFPRSAS